ncbi:MAG: transposase [Candidatus Levybacteria bacterium]|nr:transposase [Candidatus Levybacteria bacterium]
MALRKTILATNEVYHVYNRGVEKRPIFLNKREYDRFIQLANYYRFTNCPVKFSKFKVLPLEERNNIFKKLERESKLIDIYAYCLMPNHFHFLLKQLTDTGISKFIARLTNGFSHYFNIRHDRSGHLFQGNFGAVRIEDDEQLLHISRYIHLNPVTSYLVEINNLEFYDYSSYPDYLGKSSGFINPKEVMSFFKNPQEYRRFVHDQVDYARKLDNIKHLALE